MKIEAFDVIFYSCDTFMQHLMPIKFEKLIVQTFRQIVLKSKSWKHMSVIICNAFRLKA